MKNRRGCSTTLFTLHLFVSRTATDGGLRFAFPRTSCKYERLGTEKWIRSY